MIGIILVVLCILLSLGLYLRNTMLQAQIDNMADELAQIQISKEYLEANRLMTSLDAMKEYDKALLGESLPYWQRFGIHYQQKYR